MSQLIELLEKREKVVRTYNEIVDLVSKMQSKGNPVGIITGNALLKRAEEVKGQIDDLYKDLVSEMYEEYTKPI